MTRKKLPPKTRLAATKKSRQPSTALAHKKLKAALKRQIRESRPWHRRILLHPLSVLVLLCAGIFVVGLSFRAAADSYTVNGKIPAAPLGQGAVITSPADGAVITQVPINVSGTCPANSYVKLTRNGTFSGVASCTNDGTFQIQTDLFVGRNDLTAQDYNVTDDPGPTTPPITVTYNPPAAPQTTSETPAGSGTAPAPLVLISDYRYQAFLVNTNITWKLSVQGGEAPYTITTDWGDGEKSTQTVESGPAFELNHIYTQPGYYVLIIRAVDASGSSTMLQLDTLVREPGTAGTTFQSTPSTTTTQTPPPSFWQSLTSPHGLLKVAVPTVSATGLTALGFFFGERQEYLSLLRKHGLRPWHR